VAAALFWISSGLIAFTHVGYAAVLWLLRGAGVGAAGPPPDGAGELPRVSLIVAAYDEEAVIAAKVANALALDYPRERLEIIVVSDGSADATVERARQAGADLVLDLPRGGKSMAQNAAAERASGEVLAFSDANSDWEQGALRELVSAFADPAVAYACGQVSFSAASATGAAAGAPAANAAAAADGAPATMAAAGAAAPMPDNQEGLYWRYEIAVRRLESDLGGVTAGNGAIYAVRAAEYIPLGPAGSHDLSLPFLLAKRGRRSVFTPAARATELMVPSLTGEWQRKRRMMIGIWDIVVGEGMVRPGGYPPLYGFQIYAHRITRYLTPFLHLAALGSSVVLALRGRRLYAAALGVQAAVLAAAALAPATTRLAPALPLAPLRVARYYVLMTASIAAGLWDRLRAARRSRGHGSAAGPVGTWEKSEGTR